MKTTHPMKLIICGLTLLFAGALRADIVMYDYYGTVDGISGPAEPNFGGAVMGDSVYGTFSYDTTTPNFGNLDDAGYAALSMSFTVGGLTYSLPAPYIEISLANAYYWAVGGQTKTFSLGIAMYDSILPYIETDSLLRPPPDLATVDNHYGDLNFVHGGEGDNTHLYFNLDRVVLHSSSVPDTGCTLALFALSCGMLLVAKRRLVCT